MITTKNVQEFEGTHQSIKDRAAHLVQAMECIPLEEICRALVLFDQYNSPGKNPRPHRWIREFAGFESEPSGKDRDPIIVVLNDGEPVKDREELLALIKQMPR